MGDGYFLRAVKEKVGTFDIVAIDWEHPNYGYFTDAMLWYKSHHSIKWIPVQIVNWCDKYTNLPMFLEDFPELKSFFDGDFDYPMINTK